MSILFYVGEKAVSYAFPQVGAALTTVRYAHTAYNVAKASVSLLSGDIVGGGVSLASMAISQASSSMGSALPIPSGVSAEYLRCVNECHREHRDGYVWMLGVCLASCERFR